MYNDESREESLFEEALQFPSAEPRAAFLDDACRGRPELRARLAVLLEGHFVAEGFLRDTPDARPPAADDQTGAIIGRYKLLEKIGEGGFGIVYQAEQREPVKRRVALKIIKPGMDTKQVVARFEAERQALALMDHPGIARVFDGGATETGRPYFVMELVSGVPITTYCGEQQLSTGERLRLFVEVCDAVQHAHQKGIIHRDLKPSNILVTVINGRAVPKVIDFGVAKATQQELTEKTVFTQFHHFIGTPAYVSPEQAQLSSQDIDTRSDIYALGVLLYELLTGKTPFDGRQLLASGLDEMRRIIREVEPVKPSTRLTQELNSKSEVRSPKSESAIRNLKSAIPSDLDWIVMKCLEKDRTRRYATANGLATDIGRHLNHEPVVARPPSKLYEFQKTVRRHKFGFAAAAALVVVLAAGVAVSTWEALLARQAEREAVSSRKLAVTREKKSERVAGFLTDMLKAVGPSVARGRDTALLRDILARTAERVEKDLQDEPEVQADLWFTLGSTYADMGDYPRAVTNLRHAFDGYRRVLGDRDAKTALAMGRLGRYETKIQQEEQGNADSTTAVQIARQSGDRKTLTSCLYDLALAQAANGACLYVEVPYLREAIAIHRELADDPLALAACLRQLACCLSDTTNKLEGAESEQLAREALDLHRQHLGTESLDVASDLFIIAQHMGHGNKLDEAKTLGLEARALDRRILDKDHPSHIARLWFLSHLLVLRGEWDEAEAMCREAVESSPANPTYRKILGAFFLRKGDTMAAADQFAQGLAHEPFDRRASYQLAIASLVLGRTNEYWQRCQAHLERFGPGGLGTVSLLLPPDDGYVDRRWAPTDASASDSLSDYWACRAKALADLRRSRYESAVAWSDRILTNEAAPPEVKSPAHFIQAAALLGQRQIEPARAAWTKGQELLEANRTAWEFGFQWDDWMMAEFLGREAKSLLGAQPATAPKPPPN